MTIDRPDMAALVHTERVSCVLRLAVGLLLLVMTLQFEPVASWPAVAAIVTTLGWSALMTVALRSDLADAHVAKLAQWSHWFDVALPLVVYALFLPDPVATPVAALPLLAYRLAVRHGTAGVVAGGLAFVGLIAGRILFTRLTVGELLVRPPLLLAWALVGTVVLMLAAESRDKTPARASDEPSGLLLPGPVFSPAGDAVGPAPTPPAMSPVPASSPTGDDRLDSLVACLSLKLESEPPVRLTERELEVLLLLGQGHSYVKVASTLFISQSTVRNHVHNVRAKLDVPDRTELLRLARALAARAEAAQVESTRADSPQGRTDEEPGELASQG